MIIDESSDDDADVSDDADDPEKDFYNVVDDADEMMPMINETEVRDNVEDVDDDSH